MNTKKYLKIAFVTNNYTPYAGGVVSSINSFAQQLKKEGHDVIIITLDFGVAVDGEDTMVKRLSCPVKFLYKKNHMAVPWRAQRQMLKILKEFNPDVIHSQHPFLLGNVARRIARLLKIPIVFTYHTVYEDYTHYIPLPAHATRWAIKKLVKRYCAAVDLVVTPSLAVQQSLQRAQVSTPTAFICSGLQPVFVNNNKPTKPTKNTTFKLLVVSRFVSEKNVKCALDIFNTLELVKPGYFTLDLIGYGPEFFPLQEYAYSTLGLPKDRVTFTHKPEKDSIAHAYKVADVFVFTSHTDVQPLALVESLAGATPIVALAGSGRAVIQHGYNGFIAATVEDMIGYIVRLAQDPALHEQLQDNAWRSSQDFNPDNCARQLEQAYYSVVSSS